VLGILRLDLEKSRPTAVRRLIANTPTLPLVNCLLCDEAPAIDDLEYCGHCRWVLHAEIEEGWFLLHNYLQKWARFRDWELEHSAADYSLPT
jgi:hypothetical protein